LHRREFLREKKNAFGLERTANTRECGGDHALEDLRRERAGLSRIGRTFGDVDKKQSALLEFGENGVDGLPFPRDFEGVEQRACFAVELAIRSVEEIFVVQWRDC